METTLSSKGQIVLPQKIRNSLGLHPGTKFTLRIESGDIVVSPKTAHRANPRLRRDPSTGLIITHAPRATPRVTSATIRSLLADFP